MIGEVTQRQVEEARDHTTDLRDRVTMENEGGVVTTEMQDLGDILQWLAAEVRCQRLETAWRSR